MGLRGLTACILPLALVLAGSAAETQRSSAPRQHVLNFKNSPLVGVVTRISQITRQSFIYDPTLTGTVTIQVPQAVNREEALQILNTALMLHGFMTVEMQDGVRKIVPVATLGANAPLIDGAPRSQATDIVTTLVRLEHIPAEQAVRAIRPLLGQVGLVVPYPETRSLILATSEKRLHRLLGILRDLDSAGELELVILALRYNDAAETAALIEAELSPPGGQAQRQKVIPVKHSNSLIIHATSARIARIREFVEGIEIAPLGSGGLHVVPVLHTDPERLASLLNALRSAGQAAGARAAHLDSLASSDYSIVVYAPTRSLLIQADPDTFHELSRVIAELDREEPRISVEMILFEVEVGKSFALGIDFLVPLTQPRSFDDLVVNVIGQSSSASILTSAAGIMQPGVIARFVGTSVLIPIVDGAGNVITTLGLPAAHILASESVARLEILQRPNIMLINGEDQEISVGNNVPILVSARNDGGDSLSTRQTIERHDVGVRLRVTATVGQDGPVRLQIDLEQTDVIESRAGDVDDVGVTLKSRGFTGTVYLMDGETALVGGLKASRLLEGRTRVPFLADIPAIGQLFQAVRRSETDVHLMLAVQVSVSKTRAGDQLETIRRRTAFERNLAGLSGLRAATSAPYAVLLSSHAQRRYAEMELHAFDDEVYHAEIVEWRTPDSTRYDVYLTGFTEFGAAASASLEMRAAGWRPQVTVVTSGLAD